MLNEKIYVFDDIIDINSQNDIVKLLIKDYDLDGKYPFPLCTVKFNPTKSGVIVDLRDHVLMGLRSPFSCALATFLKRLGST